MPHRARNDAWTISDALGKNAVHSRWMGSCQREPGPLPGGAAEFTGAWTALHSDTPRPPHVLHKAVHRMVLTVVASGPSFA